MGKIILESNILNDNYTEYVYNAFDIQNRDKTIVEVPLNLGECKTREWNIGLIVGSSGSGKSTILKKLGEIKEPTYDNNKAIVSNFTWLKEDEVCRLFTSVGLSSVPVWLRKPSELSFGEKARLDLAWSISTAKDGEVILIDEFTSVVNRDVAKAMSNALQKFILREKKKIILASCHFDIIEWLQPDWVYNLNKGGESVEWLDCLRQRPIINLSVCRCEPEIWQMFKKHHYLTEEVNKSCKFLLFEWENKPIAICAVLNTPRKGIPEGVALSRTVVLPDYQGLGIGSKISNFVAAIFKNNAHKVYTKTVNPALGVYRNTHTELWRGTSFNGKKRTNVKSEGEKYKNRVLRESYCHEYIGEPISGYEELILPIADMRKKYKI